MRSRPLLLVLLLLGALATAASAHAALPAAPDPGRPFVAPFDEDEDEGEAGEEEGEEGELDEAEFCEPEEGEPCEEEAEPKPRQRDDECLLKDASAAVANSPGRGQLRLAIHYRALRPAAVTVEASLRGPKGAVRLGTSQARFRRSGVHRETYELVERQTKKATGAQVTVELRVVNAPAACALELTAERGG